MPEPSPTTPNLAPLAPTPSNNGGMTMHDAGAAISKLFERESTPRDEKGKFRSTQEASPAPQPPREPSPEEAATIEEPGAEDATDELNIDIDEGESTEAEQQPDIDMPKSWSSDDRDDWNALTPKAKAIVLRRETQREAGMNKLASQLKAKEAEAAKVLTDIESERKQLASQASRYANEVVKKFQAEFGDVNPSELAATDPAKFLRYQAATMAVGTAVQEAQAHEQQQTEAFNKAMTDFRQGENAKVIEQLKLDTPEKQRAFEEQVVKAAEKSGIPLTRLQQYTATELVMFDKAQKWDAAVARRKTVEQAPKQPPRVVKPGTTSSGSAKEQQEASLMKTLQKTGTVDAAAQLFKARLGGR